MEVAILPRVGSSEVPSTKLWLARICSTQRGPGARQTDNQDRIRRLVAVAGVPGQELPVEYGADVLVALLQLQRIVLDQGALHAVARIVMRPCRYIVVLVLVGLAQGEREVDALAIR